MQPVVIITGASSGIGRATALLFAEKGYCVYDLSRTGQTSRSITHIACDVTNADNVQQAVATVISQVGRVDVLISNAGYGISGAVEFTDMRDAERQFDVNFFGAVNVVQVVLPYMREQKAGRIIFTSSVAAVYAIPYQAFYSASKAAINSFCLALRNEVSSFGIHVSALMPGDIHTGFTVARMKSNAGEDVYLHQAKAIRQMEQDEQHGMSAQYIANQLYHISQKHCPAPLYTAGWQYKCLVFLNRLLPVRIVNKIVGMMYK